jgi:hypothetical protein
MLPLLVGGAELSLTARFLFSPRVAELHDQPLKLSLFVAPLANGGGGGGVAGLECGCEAAWREYAEKESRIRWSSGFGARLGDEGHCVDGGPDEANGDGLACQP